VINLCPIIWGIKPFLMELVRRTPEMNLLPNTWAFKIKRYPDGSVKKFMAKICVQGDCQKEGIDSFEMWMPVVHWRTI
jgi:hypothetical protein